MPLPILYNKMSEKYINKIEISIYFVHSFYYLRDFNKLVKSMAAGVPARQPSPVSRKDGCIFSPISRMASITWSAGMELVMPATAI